MTWDRFLIGSDNHGDMQDARAIQALADFRRIWQPKIRVHAGDNWDFRPLRRKAGEDERREALRADFDAGLAFLSILEPNYFLRGNHDERLWDLAEGTTGAGISQEYAQGLVVEATKTLKGLRCTMLPYDKREGVLELGKLKVIHGYCAGVNAARRSALAYGSVVMGHAHSIQSASIEGLDNRVGRIIGCLCRLDMQYSRATLASLVHRHGFAYGVINRRAGEYHVWQAESINGIWVLPSDVVELGRCA